MATLNAYLRAHPCPSILRYKNTDIRCTHRDGEGHEGNHRGGFSDDTESWVAFWDARQEARQEAG